MATEEEFFNHLLVKEAIMPELVEAYTKVETTNDTKEDAAIGAIKYDAGKAPVFRGALSYFPRALEAVARVSEFGAKKYAWKGWESVPNGRDRYSDALVRHLMVQGKGEIVDADSGMLHSAHAAWNALALLELELKIWEKEYVA